MSGDVGLHYGDSPPERDAEPALISGLSELPHWPGICVFVISTLNLCVMYAMFSHFYVTGTARILLPGHFLELRSFMSCHHCIHVAGLIQAGCFLPQGMFCYCCSLCTDDYVLVLS